MPLKRGTGVSAGVAVGHAVVFDTEETRVPRRTVRNDQVAGELALLERTFDLAKTEVGAEREQFAARAGSELADIFGFHEHWLADTKPRQEIASLIENKH